VLEYCQFSIGGIGTEEGVKKSRIIFERATNAVGIHVSRGSLIWETYREFENALMLYMQNDEKAAIQKERINKLFRRQLSIPLLGMDQTYIEYKMWLENETVDSGIEAAYQNAAAMLKQRNTFESQLLDLDEEESKFNDDQKDPEKRLSIFSSYLDLEFKDSSNPAPYKICTSEE